MIVLAASLALGSSAAAQTQPCADEAAKLCPGVAAAKGALLACLKQHDGELSENCRKGIARIERRAQAIKRRQPRVSTVRSAPRTTTPIPAKAPTPAPTR